MKPLIFVLVLSACASRECGTQDYGPKGTVIFEPCLTVPLVVLRKPSKEGETYEGKRVEVYVEAYSQNNGWGNGDDRAPGKSLKHNKAENGPKSHRIHGNSNPN